MVPPKNALQKILKKTFLKKKISWVAVTADQVQGGRAHGKIGEQKEKKRKKSLAKLSFEPHKRFFAYGSSKTKKTSYSNSIINNSNSSNSKKMCGSIWSSHPLDCVLRNTFGVFLLLGKCTVVVAGRRLEGTDRGLDRWGGGGRDERTMKRGGLRWRGKEEGGTDGKTDGGRRSPSPPPRKVDQEDKGKAPLLPPPSSHSLSHGRGFAQLRTTTVLQYSRKQFITKNCKCV